MASITVDINTPYVINVNDIINDNSNGNWKIVGNTLVHDNLRESYINKQYNFLQVGLSYRITYTAVHTSCDFRVFAGDTGGTIRNTSNTFVEDIVFTGTSKVIRFWSNGEVIINQLKIEKYDVNAVDSVIDITNPNNTEDLSFTVSYNPVNREKWISYHSYLPKLYLPHQTDFLKFEEDGNLDKSNSDNYTNELPFIVETVFNDNPLLTKTFDSLNTNLESYDGNTRSNDFFDSLLVYNEMQSSGEITLDNINLTKKEKDWNINKFLDMSTDAANKTLFTNDWTYKKNNYYIDKVINPSSIDVNKPWYKRGKFRDKYLIARFTYKNLEMKKIILNFVNSIYRVSIR